MKRLSEIETASQTTVEIDVLKVLVTYGPSSPLQVSLQTGHDSHRVLASMRQVGATVRPVDRRPDLNPEFQPYSHTKA